MHKHLSIMLIGLMLSNTVFALTTWTEENCVNRGGRFRDINGHRFCQNPNNVYMNWWSANVWCQQHGGQLAHVTTVCGLSPYNGARCCGNLDYTTGFWTADLANDGKAWAISCPRGICSDSTLKSTGLASKSLQPLCE